MLGFLATSIVSYITAQESLRTHIAQVSLPLTSDNIYSEVERDLLRSTLISSLMAQDTFVRDWVIAGETDATPIIRYLTEIQQRHATTTAFFVSERSRRYYHPSGIIKTVSDQDPGDAWFFRVRAMSNAYEVNVDRDTADPSRITIFINHRVVDYAGNFLGVTGIGLSVDSVAALIESYQKRYARQVYFVDRQGQVTVRGSAFRGAEHLRERPGLGEFATRILTSPSESLSYQTPQGETMYLNSRLVPEFGWYLVVEQALSQTEARLINALVLNVLLALLVTALVLGIAWFAMRGHHRELEAMATTDKLTGAANRHVFTPIFEQMIAAAKRNGDTCSLLIIDVDHFKEVNDDLGHEAGDTVLRGVADVLRESLRAADCVCRWGGDEFVVLLAQCTIDGAIASAAKIRRMVNDQPLILSHRVHRVTVSIGAAERRPDESLAALISRADAALYASKQAGRDRVTAAGDGATRGTDSDTRSGTQTGTAPPHAPLNAGEGR